MDRYKIILTNSINEFNNSNSAKRLELIKYVVDKLNEHNDSMIAINTGYSKDLVKAGRIFIRWVSIYKNE